MVIQCMKGYLYLMQIAFYSNIQQEISFHFIGIISKMR